MLLQSSYASSGPETYTSRLKQTLHRLVDCMALIAAGCAILIVLRSDEVTLRTVIALVALGALSIFPSLILRGDKYLHLRGALAAVGIQIPIFVGFVSFGINSSAIVAIPFYLALVAVLFSRRVTFLVFAVLVAFIGLVGLSFNFEIISGPDITIADWNKDERGWYILFFIFVSHGVMLILLTQSLRRFWAEKNEEVHRNTLQLEAIMTYAPYAIVISDSDQRFVTANQRASDLFGIPLDELLEGPGIGDLSPEFQPCGTLSSELSIQYQAEALGGGHPMFEWTFLNTSGAEVICEVTLSQIPPFDKQLIRGSIIDITERKREQEERQDLLLQLATSQRLEAIGKLTGGVAHDFNNLLAIILGNLELFREEHGHEQDELIQPCIDASLRGAELTKSMLSFARRARLSPQEVNLNSLLLELKAWTGRALPENVAVEMTLEQDIWPVRADPSATENAILNLILNARDAMPDGGILRIDTENIKLSEQASCGQSEMLKPGHYVVLTVTDNGEGIDPDILSSVFDPFFTTKLPGQGSGMGLSMVQGFMRQSCGGVQIESEHGAGVTVRLFFPATTAPQDAKLNEPDSQVIAPSRGEQILLVEDEYQVLQMLTSMLTSAGYNVTPCISGDQALQLFEKGKFDLLLTDIVMPGKLQGPMLARELIALDQDLPVLFMSGYASQGLVQDERSRTDTIYLTKPVLRDDLLSAITRSLSVGVT